MIKNSRPSTFDRTFTRGHRVIFATCLPCDSLFTSAGSPRARLGTRRHARPGATAGASGRPFIVTVIVTVIDQAGITRRSALSGIRAWAPRRRVPHRALILIALLVSRLPTPGISHALRLAPVRPGVATGRNDQGSLTTLLRPASHLSPRSLRHALSAEPDRPPARPPGWFSASSSSSTSGHEPAHGWRARSRCPRPPTAPPTSDA
jgi:hypothetical protein